MHANTKHRVEDKVAQAELNAFASFGRCAAIFDRISSNFDRSVNE